MAIIHEDSHTKPKIDLRGSQGNAYCILGYALNLSKQLGHTKEQSDSIQALMQSSDYDNLIDTFEDNFGEYVDLIK
jgi:hypothetical protein